MKFKPLQDRVLVRRNPTEEVLASGLILAPSSTEKPEQGTVLAVGPGKRDSNGRLHPVTLKVHDQVLFQKYAGQLVKVDGEELIMMTEGDVFAVVEK